MPLRPCRGSGNYADGAQAEASLTFFSVGFVTDDGGTVEPQVVAEGGKVTAPAELVKTGYTFGGWYSDEALTRAWDFDASTVDGATTLYVKWTKTAYAVSVETDGGGTASASVTTATMGDEVTLTAEPADGYHFGGWEVVSGEVALNGDSFAMPAGDVTVRAVFEPHVYGACEPNQDGTHTRICTVCGAKDPEHEAPADGPSPEPEPEEEAKPEDAEPTVPQTGDAGALFSLPLALLGSLAAGAGLALRRRRS